MTAWTVVGAVAAGIAALAALGTVGLTVHYANAARRTAERDQLRRVGQAVERLIMASAPTNLGQLSTDWWLRRSELRVEIAGHERTLRECARAASGTRTDETAKGITHCLALRARAEVADAVGGCAKRVRG
jgi:hypothetical protein